MRLTDKGRCSLNIDEDISGEYCPNSSLSDCIEKLGQLEDIEDELGIELPVFVTAVLVGFYYKDISSHNIPYIGFARGKKTNKNYFRVNNHQFYFKDYGKTWALNREELEK